MFIKKKKITCYILDFGIQADYWKQKKSKMLEKYLDLAREYKKSQEHDCDGASPQKLGEL